jgi:putative tricarboxylic transport membrane protein
MIRSRYLAEATFAAVTMVAGVALFIYAPTLVRGWAFTIPGTTDAALEPSFFPRLASGLLAISAFTVLVTVPLRHDVLPVAQLTRQNYRNVGFGLIGIFAYLALIEVLGFVTSSSIFIATATWLSGYRRLSVLLPTAVLVSVALRLVFRFGLHVGLPTGLFY